MGVHVVAGFKAAVKTEVAYAAKKNGGRGGGEGEESPRGDMYARDEAIGARPKSRRGRYADKARGKARSKTLNLNPEPKP